MGCREKAEVLAEFARAGDALSFQLQQDGAKSFVRSWNELMPVIDSKSTVLKKASRFIKVKQASESAKSIYPTFTE
jgi:hypothetical protein